MTFWDAFKNSTIIQAIITLVVLLAVCYLAIMQLPIPDLLSTTTALIVGFYFGSKVQASKIMQGPS